jgi:hypothetical protein
MRMNKPCSQHAQSVPVTAHKPKSLRTLASASELILDAGLFITLPVLVAEPVLGAGGASGAGAAAGGGPRTTVDLVEGALGSGNPDMGSTSMLQLFGTAGDFALAFAFPLAGVSAFHSLTTCSNFLAGALAGAFDDAEALPNIPRMLAFVVSTALGGMTTTF